MKTYIWNYFIRHIRLTVDVRTSYCIYLYINLEPPCLEHWHYRQPRKIPQKNVPTSQVHIMVVYGMKHIAFPNTSSFKDIALYVWTYYCIHISVISRPDMSNSSTEHGESVYRNIYKPWWRIRYESLELETRTGQPNPTTGTIILYLSLFGHK
jgi:hypothetical protein